MEKYPRKARLFVVETPGHACGLGADKGLLAWAGSEVVVDGRFCVAVDVHKGPARCSQGLSGELLSLRRVPGFHPDGDAARHAGFTRINQHMNKLHGAGVAPLIGKCGPQLSCHSRLHTVLCSLLCGEFR